MKQIVSWKDECKMNNGKCDDNDDDDWKCLTNENFAYSFWYKKLLIAQELDYWLKINFSFGLKIICF